jgi:hypothetical protein
VTATQLEPGLWRLEWASDLASPTFYLWMDGVFVLSTGAGSIEVAVSVPSSPVFSVFDDADAAPSNVYPAGVLIQWDQPTDLEVEYYLVEEYVAAAWTERTRVTADPARWQYEFQTRPLEDVTTHQFRVTPVGVNGNAGAARTYSVYMVRNPDPPDVALSYDDGTQKITVASA